MEPVCRGCGRDDVPLCYLTADGRKSVSPVCEPCREDEVRRESKSFRPMRDRVVGVTIARRNDNRLRSANESAYNGRGRSYS